MKQKNKPKISVIMSVYNSEKYLVESIESILNQTFEDFEFIIINDGSTDGSLDIIKKYQKKDKRIILIDNKKNLGLIKSLNKGLEKSRGKYIARMDSDDISLHERFKKQINFLEHNESVFLIGTEGYNIDEFGNLTTKARRLDNFSEIRKKLPKVDLFCHPSVMFRNEGNIFYREKAIYCEDYDLWLRPLSEGKVLVNLKKDLIRYRVSKYSVSMNKAAKQQLFVEKIRQFYFQRLKYGKDKYERFDPKEILELDIEKSTNKLVLESEIKSNFKINNFDETRNYCKKYFKNYGYKNKFLVYYFSTFLGKSAIKFLRKIVFNGFFF